MGYNGEYRKAAAAFRTAVDRSLYHFSVSDSTVVVAAYLAYPFHSTTVTEIFEWGFLFVILVALFQLNLLIATNIRNTLAVAFALTALVSGIAFSFLHFGDEEDAFYLPLPSSALVPPAFQLSRASSLDDYFSRVARETIDSDGQN